MADDLLQETSMLAILADEDESDLALTRKMAEVLAHIGAQVGIRSCDLE